MGLADLCRVVCPDQVWVALSLRQCLAVQRLRLCRVVLTLHNLDEQL